MGETSYRLISDDGEYVVNTPDRVPDPGDFTIGRNGAGELYWVAPGQPAPADCN